MKKIKCFTVLAAILTSIIFVQIARAQHFYFNPISKYNTQIGLRYLRPMVKREATPGLSGAWELNLLQTYRKAGFIVSVPFSSISNGGENSESSLGNLFLGLQLPSPDNTTTFTIGATLPTASKNKYNAATVGYLSDFMSFFKYIPETITIYSNVAYHLQNQGNGILAFEAGPDLIIPSNGGDSELFLHYGMQGGVKISKVSLLSEFNGLLMMTGEHRSISERTFHNITLGTEFDLGMVHPGIFYTLYVDKELSAIKILGFKMDINIK